MARAIDTASVSANRATAIAIGVSFSMVPADRSGLDKGGSPMRNAPILPMPVRRLPNSWSSSSAAKLPTSMAAIMCGIFGHQRRVASPGWQPP